MVKVFVVVCFLILLGWRLVSFYDERPGYHDGQTISLEAVLQEEPDLSNKGQKFAVTDAYNRTVYVTAEAFPQLHFGQVLRVSGKMHIKEYEDGFILYSLYKPQVEVIGNHSGMISVLADEIRGRSKTLFESVLPPISAGLLMGIIFGSKEHFPDAFFDALQRTGVLHVIAASGMNITFVSAALLFSLGMVMRRQYALIFGCFGIVFYVFLVGFEPSIIRAAIMGVLAFVASLFGRQHIAAFTVLLAAYGMLLVQPGFLFDLGFQLSFFATLGIIFVKPLLDFGWSAGLEKLGVLRFLGETVSTTLAAQIGTLPLLFGTFGEVGLLSLLVNAIVLWTVPLLMLLGSLAIIFNLLFAPISHVILMLCIPLLVFFEATVTFFGTMDWMLMIPTMPIGIWVGYYFLIAAVVLFKKPDIKQQKASILSDLQ